MGPETSPSVIHLFFTFVEYVCLIFHKKHTAKAWRVFSWIGFLGPTTTSSTTNFIELYITWVITKNSSTTFRMKALSSGENVSFSSFLWYYGCEQNLPPTQLPTWPKKGSPQSPWHLYTPLGLQTALISRTWQRNKPSMSDWIPLRMLLVGWWVQQIKTYSPNWCFL